MTLTLDGWKFQVDVARTMAYSAAEAAEHCDCAYCRNFYAAVDEAHPALRPFLAQFGVDVEAPEEMVPAFYADGTLAYEPSYRVFGRLLQAGDREIVAGMCTISAENGEEDCFFLDCHDVFLRWTLDEPMEDVISPANDPLLLEEAMLRQLFRSDTDSILN